VKYDTMYVTRGLSRPVTPALRLTPPAIKC